VGGRADDNFRNTGVKVDAAVTGSRASFHIVGSNRPWIHCSAALNAL